MLFRLEAISYVNIDGLQPFLDPRRKYICLFFCNVAFEEFAICCRWLNHFHRAWYSNIRFFIWGKPLYIMHADKKEAFKKMEFLFIKMYEFGIVRCYFIIYMYVYQYAIK